MKKAYLALEDGGVYEGRSVGAEGEAFGELVFNTSMTGYQEILTDPSYAGQIITMTYPLIGNYGVNPEDVESRRPFARGFVMRECCLEPSSWRARQSLPDYLRQHNIIGVDGLDTRKITKHLRTAGAKKAVISTQESDPERLVRMAKDSPGMTGADYVKDVTAEAAYAWEVPAETRFRVAAFDYGIKFNILRILREMGCAVTVLPATATAEDALATDPDGIFLSNGPGDPAALTYTFPVVRELLGKKPVFSICLGHQLLAHALGGSTYKLKFGHRGGNQPVRNNHTGKVEISAQNHGFAVDAESLDPSTVFISHTNLNDQSVEGLEHKEVPAFGVQYHPEASPGPHDSSYLFDRFVAEMERHKGAVLA